METMTTGELRQLWRLRCRGDAVRLAARLVEQERQYGEKLNQAGLLLLHRARQALLREVWR